MLTCLLSYTCTYIKLIASTINQAKGNNKISGLCVTEQNLFTLPPVPCVNSTGGLILTLRRLCTRTIKPHVKMSFF